MKKAISILLCVIMAFSVFPVMSLAADNNKNLPMIFMTGIGQTVSYVEKKNGKSDFSYKSIDENGEFKTDIIKYNKSGNIINFGDLGAILKSLLNKESIPALTQFLFSLICGKYMIDYDDLGALARELFRLNISDENGKLPEEVVTPFYTYPVKEYNEDARNRFNKTVPHPELIEAYGEDRIFCFNYSPFGNIDTLAEELNNYINNVQEEYFPGQKVILVPMSMGAAPVSLYLNKYGDQGDVAKVISAVGCWDGSDAFADIVEGKYAEDSSLIFYSNLLGNYFDEATTAALQVLFHLFSKDKLMTPLVRNVVNALRDEVILKSSTMTALIPSSRYEAIRNTYLIRPGYEDVLKAADAYYNAQKELKNTMKTLNRTVGTEFYFIAGYGLPFGEVTSEYTFFKCFESAGVTNSDEIIHIGSTTVGATSVTAGTRFSDAYIENAKANGTYKYISPDKSVDLSTAVFPDHCFVFYEQKHELEYNNVAIDTILEIAKGNIKDIHYNEEKLPQFNERRNLKDYNNYYRTATALIGDAVAYGDKTDRHYSDILGEDYEAFKAEAEALVAEGDAMTSTTVIDPESDDKVIEKFRVFHEKVFATADPPKKSIEDKFEDAKNNAGNAIKSFFAPILKKLNQAIFEKTGPKGIPDLIF
ncbi:MAG: hypothetical protein IJB86_02310 [Clostridia bacterium]|nr:hypothetical protein [Clostridia bacterium]